jgi:DNA-directed RNA polymerase
MQSISLLKEEDERKLKVTKTRQKSAFAPNFVHSLDSTHMMMTAIECSKRGIAFAGVHDSFWTHAGDIERMNKILRDQFIKMHKQDILGKLKKELETKYKEKMAPATSSASSLSKSGSGGGYKKHNNNCFLIEDVPKRGDLNLDDLKESVYFFS